MALRLCVFGCAGQVESRDPEGVERIRVQSRRRYEVGKDKRAGWVG